MITRSLPQAGEKRFVDNDRRIFRLSSSVHTDGADRIRPRLRRNHFQTVVSAGSPAERAKADRGDVPDLQGQAPAHREGPADANGCFALPVMPPARSAAVAHRKFLRNGPASSCITFKQIYFKPLTSSSHQTCAAHAAAQHGHRRICRCICRAVSAMGRSFGRDFKRAERRCSRFWYIDCADFARSASSNTGRLIAPEYSFCEFAGERA